MKKYTILMALGIFLHAESNFAAKQHTVSDVSNVENKATEIVDTKVDDSQKLTSQQQGLEKCCTPSNGGDWNSKHLTCKFSAKNSMLKNCCNNNSGYMNPTTDPLVCYAPRKNGLLL